MKELDGDEGPVTQAHSEEPMADQAAEQLQTLLDRLASGTAPRDLLRAAAEDPAALETARLAVLGHNAARVLPVAAPAPFKAALQVRIQQEMLRPPVAPPALSSLQRWLIRFSAAWLSLALVFGSAVAASAASLPGQVLYPIKRAVEDTRLAFAGGADERAELRLEMALARTAELRALLAGGEAVDAAFAEDVVAAHQTAASAAASAGDRSLAGRVAASSREARALLAGASAGPSNTGSPPAETVAAWLAGAATATPTAVSSASHPVKRPVAATVVGGAGTTATAESPRADAPSGRTDAPPAIGPPVRTAAPAPATREPARRPTERPATSAPSAVPPVAPTATPIVPTATLVRDSQREATVRAPSATPDRGQAGQATPDPSGVDPLLPPHGCGGCPPGEHPPLPPGGPRPTAGAGR